MAELIDRVRKLIALSSSPYLEEARSAAFQACELVRGHALEVVRASDLEALRLECERLRGELRAAAAQQSARAFDAPPQSQWTAGGARLIRSDFDGRCRRCGRRYYVGDWIWWERGRGARHEGCVDPSGY